MEVIFPEIKVLLKAIYSLKEEIAGKQDSALVSQWYNDEQCWQLKGGMALNTYRNNRFFQCKGGIPDGYVGGRKVWSRDSVREWLNLTDDELEDYHKKYRTGAKRK